ncbi:hypothetical protein [Saccharothrix lopnurensis]|uniref:Minor tail protein n=1 Tax=Saccharothrix lopnurensis TaxID=1670621 RepID=A0ABW1P5M4_9PSEU
MADDVEWTLDGITFNVGPDENGVEWAVEYERGWSGGATPRSARSVRVSGHGSYRGPAYRAERLVELTCWAHAPTREARRRAEHRLAALCSDPGRLYPLLCLEETGPLTAYVELDDELDPIISRDGRWLDFVIALAAPDPRKYGPWTSAEAEPPSDPPGGVDATTAGGVDATTAGGVDAGGGGSTGRLSITNAGTALVGPLFELVGPLPANTELADTTTGETLRYTAAIAAGQLVVINADEHPVEYGGVIYPARSVLLTNPANPADVADRGAFLGLVGDWPTIQPGQTGTWAFRPPSGASPAARARIHLRPANW